MNEDETTITVVTRINEAISHACNRRYEDAIDSLIEATEWLEILRDDYELCLED